MRQVIEKDLAKKRFKKEKVLALIVKLMDEAYFRVGNQNYAKQNETYGITTLRRRHLSLETQSVTFNFIGKSGQKHHKTISDKRITRLIKQLDDLPGYEIFQYIDEHGELHKVSSNDVNNYIKANMGEVFSAKDFRTWGGTLVAVTELAAKKPAKASKDREKHIRHVVKRVAKRLGNTPAVARSSYIDPRVIESYLKDDSIRTISETMNRMRPKKYLKNEERCVIELLQNTK